MKETLSDIGSEMRVEVIMSEADVIDAVADTWEFMTGEQMPESVVICARQKATESKQIDVSPWSLKLLHQAQVRRDFDPFVKQVYDFGKTGVQFADTQAEKACSTELTAPSPFLTELAKALGDRVLEDAYLAIGPDMDLFVLDAQRVLGSDTEDVEKARLITKILLQSFERMKQEKPRAQTVLEDIDSGLDVHDGHVMKLSPYHLRDGNELVFKPSCLLMSIMGASFMKKVGVDTIVHAGVVTPQHFPYAAAVHDIANEVTEILTNNAYPSPNHLLDRLEAAKVDAGKYVSDWEPHSCFLFSVGDQSVLVDPYQRTNTILGEVDVERLRSASELVQGFPNTELLHMPSLDQKHCFHSYTAMAIYDITMRLLPDKERWRKALDSAVLSNSVYPIIELLDTVYGSEVYADDLESSFTGFLVQSNLFGYSEEPAPEVTSKFIYRCIAQQLFGLKSFTTEEVSKALVLCDSNATYRENRVEDLFNLPWRMLLAGLQDEWRRQSDSNTYLHPALELGQLEHRVGMTALLDVSYGLGTPLPFSFWASQSSSQLPWLYAEQTKENGNQESRVGRQALEIVADLIKSDTWRYRQIIAKIT